MNYKLNEIEWVKAAKISRNEKTDVQVRIQIKLKNAFDLQNLQVKLVSQKKVLIKLIRDGQIRIRNY